MLTTKKNKPGFRPNRSKYDSSLAWYYANGKESLIPASIREKIPDSTASTWRKTSYQSYVGHEMRELQANAMNHYEILQQHQALLKTVKVITRVWITASQILMPALHKKKKYRDLIFDSIDELRTVLSLKRTLKLVRMKARAYNARVLWWQKQCATSVIQLCVKRHPQQLTPPEVKKIISIVQNPTYATWPLISIYYHGIRTNELTMGHTAFYETLKKYGFKAEIHYQKKRPEGLKATAPNQYLHVDTTFWDLDVKPDEPRKKAAIVFVTDNYSKNILGCSISTQKNSMNVAAAIDMAIQTMRKTYSAQAQSHIIADGGTENHAWPVNDLLSRTNLPALTKLIAQKDIRYSNSAIESINKIAKRYLRVLKPKTIEGLNESVAWFMKDYCEIRPHGSLAGLTPMEAYAGVPNLNLKIVLKAARKKRLEDNKNSCCSNCK